MKTKTDKIFYGALSVILAYFIFQAIMGLMA